MRVIFYDIKNNPFLLRTYENILHRNKIKTNKDGAILRDALKRADMEVYNYVPEKGFIQGMRDAFTYRINHLEGKKIRQISSLDVIQPDDIFIGWYFMPRHMDFMKQLTCKKIVMGQHFIMLPYQTDFSSMGVSAFVNQTDVSHNPFINHFFNLKDVRCVTLPYTYEARFSDTKSFQLRKPKAISIGTISTVNGKNYDTYLEYMKSACLQPMRKEIYEHGDNEQLDVYNNFIFTMGYHNGISSDTRLVDYIKAKISDRREVGQASYYTFDMVEKFNEYMMCVCGEELVGLPGVGFVESMACGCVYIGLDHEMYRGLGMIPDVHYITYDGTYEGLNATIERYSKDVDRLQEIAQNGKRFILEVLKEEKVMQDFWASLKEL